MGDRSHPLELLRQAAAGRVLAGLDRRLAPRGPGLDGLLDLASNDYLGLCGDERLAAGAAEAARKWGTGSTGSRLVTGTTMLHAELESQLAEFTGAPAALVFSSGYLANLTVITALAAGLGVARGVLIVSDARNHASLIDACRLARTQGGGRHGVRAGCFRPPSVPAGEACLRLTGRADMTMRDFTIAARALAAVSEHSVS